MKNIHNKNEKKFHYSLRKIGGKGVVSAVIAVGFFFLGTSAVEAADVSSTEAVASSTTNTDKNLQKETNSTTELVSTEKKANVEKNTYKVVTPSLEEAVDSAKKEDLTVTKEKTEVKENIESAVKDNLKQAEEIQTSVKDYTTEKEKYNKAKQSYDKKVAEKEAADAVNKENEAKYNKELQAYNTANNKYVTDKAAYDSALAKYNNDLSTYEKNLAEYKILLKQFQDAKEAYDKYVNDSNYRDIKEVETVQDLTFQRENNATHKIDGISTYLTREAQSRLNTSNVAQYDSNKLTSDDIVSTSPWANNEVEYVQIKEGDKFVVTYDGLNQSHMNEKDKSKNDITRVIYRYEILSLPSNDGKGIAAVNNDPTVTLTVGASTDKDKPVKVAVDVEFYDNAGNKFDLQKYNAIVALNSLNHWTGASYVDNGDKPRELTVEAKDTNGNVVRGTWNPYADGSSMSIENNAVVTKSGTANFGSGVTVNISADNPLKVVTQKATWNGSEFAVSEESVTSATSVNASGGGNGHSIGAEEYKFEDKDDVIGTYSINSITGEITFTPKKKFENIEHQEFVNVGNNKFIPIPNSSVTYDANTKEVTSLKDNQYIEHGSVFNGESSSTLEGWDNPNSKYLYYGGAGLKMTDGHLVFTANGANASGQPTVYWFAINSQVGLPQKPGKEPVEPTKPTPPVAPTEPTKPTPPTPKVVEVPNKPVVPTKPEIKWHENVIEVEKTTPQTPPVTPPNKPNKPVKPNKVKAKHLPNTGESDTNSALAGLGLLTLAGAALRRKQNQD